MNIQQMKYAIEVGKTGSISQAAENLYMGQPNLSKAIKELEASLGIQIFKRTSKGVQTTPGGADFLKRARRIVAEIEDMERTYRAENSIETKFRISVPRSSYIAAAFTSFVSDMDADPPVSVVFSETGAMRAIRNILDEGYNLAIIRYQSLCEPYFVQLLEEQGLESETIWEFDSVVLLSRDSPAATKTVLQLSDLENCTELVHGDCGMHEGTQCKNNQDSRAVCAQKRICIYERGSQFDLLSRVPRTYMWVSPMPADVLARNNLAQKFCTDSTNRCKDVLVYRAGHVFSGAEHRFLERIEEAKTMVAQYPCEVRST